MAEESKDQAVTVQGEGVGEVKERGLFDYFKGKEEAPEEKPQHEEDQQESLVTGVGNIHIDEGHKEEEKKEKEEEKHVFFDKLHRSHSSSSSSSSDEEEVVEGEGGIKEKIKKKKGLKEKIDEKFHGGEKKEEEPAEDTSVVVEKVDVHETLEASEEEKKQGFLHKIKEKLPGHGKKPAEESGFVSPASSPAVPAAIDGAALEHGKEHEVEGHEGKEKKGFLGKIMEKLPGYHKNAGEEGDKSPASH